MIGPLTADQLWFLVILGVGFGLFLTEPIRNDVTAVLVLMALNLSGVLSAEEALAGFGSEPAIIVAGVFVLSGAMHQTGLSEILGGWIGRLSGRGFTRMTAVIMPSVAGLSAFTHHLTTTAVMLPVTLNLSRDRGISPSRLLMPLSFAASLGTTITIIGAPAFLIASEVLQRADRPGLGIFSIAPIGLVLTLVGTAYVVLVGRWLLPDRPGGEEPVSRFRLDNYFTEITLLPGSSLVGRRVEELETDARFGFRVEGWTRGGEPVDRSAWRRPRLRAGDVLLVRTDPDRIVAIREEPGVEFKAVRQFAEHLHEGGGGGEEHLVQAVVAPGSDLVGRTLAEADFLRRYGAPVVSLWRRQGWLRGALDRVRLRAGDVLVLQGTDAALERVARDHAFLLIIPFEGELRLRRKAYVAGALMVATVLGAASGLMALEMAFVAGAVGVVLLRCITVTQAYRAIDTRIYVFIAGVIPLGRAMEETGTSDLLARWLQGAVGGWEQIWALAALFAIVAVITQFMSDAATTALFAPVAVALAAALGQPPEAYVVTVAMAAVASFLTPIGHHGNLLVYGPGRYNFMDFVRVGTPLTVLVAVVVVVMAAAIW